MPPRRPKRRRLEDRAVILAYTFGGGGEVDMRGCHPAALLVVGMDGLMQQGHNDHGAAR